MSEAREPERTGGGHEVEPDVLLDIPEVSVDSLRLAVDGLDADLSLRARLANLLQIDAGVRVHLAGAELDLQGVSAEALLKVRLEKLVEILDRALTTLDRNPEIVQALARTADVSLNDVNRVADRPATAAAPVVDEAGQQVGSIGAVADRSLREAARAAGPAGPAEPVAATSAQRPTGPRPESPAGPSPVGSPPEPPLEPPPTSRPPRPGAEVPAGGPPPAPTGPRPADRGTTAGDRERRGTSPASQFAGQAGETLRQAGRSVWEAVQGGMAQRRQGQQRPDR
ncbi:hypothetical protein [Micromonospora halophytica]|uniref:Uncharacterized protein n=1 Tax=Micromonospora halophytica TaxID=47864 RepID=A0A1C5JC28_9ACTN|nr:hypothetical protein [Micromonospora halophytica]SCG68144.1 hypothetical protein GA0070560_12721 [Micromonospora halophytica]